MSEGSEELKICPSNDRESLLNYQENSCNTFYRKEEGRKPTEITSQGTYIMSATENGESIVLYEPSFLGEEEATVLMNRLLLTPNWQMKNITIRGVEYPQPRLVAWYGPLPYSYSGSTMEPEEMPNFIIRIKRKIEQYLRKNGINVILNSVLLNLYRHNRDSVSWHSDDELSMGTKPTIASVSLGATRRFEMRRKFKPTNENSVTNVDEYFINLKNGSLFIMDGSTQKDWVHRVPKEYQTKYERINLTFRTVYKLESLLTFPDTLTKKDYTRPTKVSCRKKIVYNEKTSDSDTNSLCSITVRKTQDLCSSYKTVVETNRSPKIDIKPSYSDSSLETRNKRNSSYNKITWKTENELNEPDKEQGPELSYNKKSPLLNNLNDDKKIKNTTQYKNINDFIYSSNNITNLDENAGENKRFRIDSPSIHTNSPVPSIPTNSPVSSMKINNCKIKNEPSCSTDSRWTLNVEAEKFIPINTCTTPSRNNLFSSFRLKSLLNFNVDEMNTKLLTEYAAAFKNRVLENMNEFALIEQNELDILCQLTDDSQTEENRKRIKKMYFIVDKALNQQLGSQSNLNSVGNLQQSYHKRQNSDSQTLKQDD